MFRIQVCKVDRCIALWFEVSYKCGCCHFHLLYCNELFKNHPVSFGKWVDICTLFSLMHPFSPHLFICKQFLYCKTLSIVWFKIAYMSLWIGWNYCAHLHGFDQHGITKTIEDLLVNKWCSLFHHLSLGFRVMGLGIIICCLFASKLRI
jgi:hypothetical protein